MDDRPRVGGAFRAMWCRRAKMRQRYHGVNRVTRPTPDRLHSQNDPPLENDDMLRRRIRWIRGDEARSWSSARTYR